MNGLIKWETYGTGAVRPGRISLAAARLADGTEFSTLFPGYSEADVISWVETIGLLGDGDPNFNTYGGRDSAVSAWFDIPAPNDPAVPEPSTMGTAVLAIGALVVTLRRRSKS